MIPAPPPVTAAQIAGVGLELDRRPLASRPLPAQTLTDLVWACRHHRLVGLLVEAVRRGQLPVGDDQLTLIEAAAVDVAAHEVRVEELLLHILDWFSFHAVPVRVLKGPSAAHRFYPDPAHRGFADLDLLVPSWAIDKGVRVLRSYRIERLVPELRPRFDSRFAKSVTTRSPGGIEVDVHRMLSVGPFGLRIPEADLWSSDGLFGLAGRSVPALPVTETFLHAAVHIASGRNLRMMSLRDLLQIVRHPEFDLAHARGLVDRWGLAAVVRHAVTIAHRTLRLEGTDLLQWAQELPVTAGQVSELAVALDISDTAGRERLGWSELDRLNDRVAYAWAFVWPARDNLRARGRSRRQHVRRVLEGLAG